MIRRITAYLLALLLFFSSSIAYSGSLTLIGAGKAASAGGGDTPGGALTIQAVGTVAAATGGTGSTALSVTIPASASSGERLLVVGVIRSANNGSAPTMPGGWTLIGSVLGGGGTWGYGEGPTRAFAFSKTSDGTEGGTSVDVTNDRGSDGGARIYAVAIRVSKTNSNWVAEAFTSGEDTTGGTSWSAAGSSISMIQNDLVWTIAGWNLDEFGTSEAISASGVTFSSGTERAETSNFAGNQLGWNLWSWPVSSGTSAAPTFTQTMTGGSPYGVTMFVRMRDSS